MTLADGPDSPDVKRLLTLALVLVVALAGCSGGTTTTTAPPDQPTPTPTATPTPVPDGAPPGVTTGDVDTETLVDAHVDALEDRSYTLSVEQRIGNGGLTISAQAGASRLPALVTVEADGASRSTYITESGAYERRLGGGNETTRRVNLSASDVPTGVTQLEQVLTDATFAYNGTVERDGRTLYRLSADLDDLTRQFNNVDPVYFQADLLVDGDGLVHSVDYVLSVKDGDTINDLELYLDLSALDSTTVSEPGWVDTVGEDSGTSRTLTDADLGFRFTVSGPTENVSTVSLRNASQRFYDVDVVEAARASPQVEVVTERAVDTRNVQMDYNSSAAPGSDDELFIFVYHPRYQTYLPMETSVDPANGTAVATRIQPDVTVSVSGEQVTPTLDPLEDRYVFVVMHAKTFYDAFD